MKRMRLLTFLIFIALLTISCKTKIDTNKIALAIEKDNIVRFEKLSSKINLDTCKFGEGRNALHYALQLNSTKILNKLIDDNFMLNETDSLNFTPLLYAVHTDKKEIINKLLEKDISLNDIESYNGFSSIHYAVYNNDIDLTKKLVSKNVNVNLKNESIMSSTPLHIAIEKENAVIAKLLIDNGATDTIKDVNDHTVIDLSSRSTNPNIIKLFYDKMSQEEKEKLLVNTVRNSGDIDFLTKLLDEKWVSKKQINDLFVFAKDTITSKALLDKGASIKKLHSRYDYGAIHYAAIRGDTIMLDFLLKNGANINQLSKERTVSPLMYAAQLNGEINNLNKKTKKLNININAMFYDMLGKSADKNKQNSMEAVKYLITKKADLQFKNKSGENALYYADASFNHEVANYLKEIGIKQTKKFVESKADQMRRILNN